MKESEDIELRRALRRVEAPDGFADRLRARIEQSEPVSPKLRATRAFSGDRTKVAALALAATLIIAAGGAWYRAEEQRRVQGEEAKRQVLVSLNIASNKLRAIEIKVNRGEDR
jgi:hypothetical protein